MIDRERDRERERERQRDRETERETEKERIIVFIFRIFRVKFSQK